MTRQHLVLTALVSIALTQPCLAGRRGAKLYKNKETAADMTQIKRVFLGWADFRAEDYSAHGYSSKSEWTTAEASFNAELKRLCQTKYLDGKTVTAASEPGDERAGDADLIIKFSRVRPDYNNYHLYLTIHFVDAKTNAEIGVIPNRPYYGDDWGFERYLRAAMDDVGRKIDVEVSRVPKGKSPR